jgi:hypothetical protein
LNGFAVQDAIIELAIWSFAGFVPGQLYLNGSGNPFAQKLGVQPGPFDNNRHRVALDHRVIDAP